MLIAADAKEMLLISGTGEVIKPDSVFWQLGSEDHLRMQQQLHCMKIRSWMQGKLPERLLKLPRRFVCIPMIILR